MANSHYVPKLILRKFSNKLCLFNVRTGEFKENVRIDNAYSEKGFYSDEVEAKLNRRIESFFGNLLSNKILKADKTIEISRDELCLIKKFLLISVIRSYGSEELAQLEKRFYVNSQTIRRAYLILQGFFPNDIDKILSEFKPPFEEKIIQNESSFDYWMRTLNVILDTNGTQEEILKHPDKTYPAYRWAEVINNGYLSFWDSEFDHDEFVITDIGMTSENEKGWNGITVQNLKKTKFLCNLFKNEKNNNMKMIIDDIMCKHDNFTENFMMFPISAKRMIVEIDPFYKFRIAYKQYYKMPDLDYLTKIPNEELFYPNQNKYILPQEPLHDPVYHPDDKYIYEIKKLTSKETIYCNELFMDRINTYLGFSSIDKAVRSILAYKKDTSYPSFPRANYTKLYELINKRYRTSTDGESIGGFGL